MHGKTRKMSANTLIRIEGLHKTYHRGQEIVEALRGIDLMVEEGEFLTVMGPSGCGKSTLLHIIGGIDRPTAGRVVVDGVDLGSLDEEALTRFRREKVGFVFQFYNLLPTLTALQNVELPLIALGYPRVARRTMARAVLEMVGLGDRLHHKPAELSGGQQQRVAIARAIVANRRLILADEPTGDLDSVSSRQVVDLMWNLNQSLGLTFIIVTHDPAVGERGTRTIYLQDGRVVGEERRGMLQATEVRGGALPGRAVCSPAVPHSTSSSGIVLTLVGALRVDQSREEVDG
jgi:putative ABC transport system ATP-binding protein